MWKKSRKKKSMIKSNMDNHQLWVSLWNETDILENFFDWIYKNSFFFIKIQFFLLRETENVTYVELYSYFFFKSSSYFQLSFLGKDKTLKNSEGRGNEGIFPLSFHTRNRGEGVVQDLNLFFQIQGRGNFSWWLRIIWTMQY